MIKDEKINHANDFYCFMKIPDMIVGFLAQIPCNCPKLTIPVRKDDEFSKDLGVDKLTFGLTFLKIILINRSFVVYIS